MKSVRITFRISPGQRNKLELLAKKAKVDLTHIVKEALKAVYKI